MSTEASMDSRVRKILSYHMWRQSIDLGDGIRTPGGVHPSLWTLLGMPDSLSGRSFLDVGANDGMFSFEAEKRGAIRVVASDLYKTGIDSMKNGWSAEGINLLRDYRHSKVEIHTKGIYYLRELNEKFDVVFVNNIINWLEDIETAMDNISGACRGTLYLSDGFILDESKPIAEKQNHPSLRYMYNVPYIKILLEKRGFRIDEVRRINYERVFVEEYLYTPEITTEKKTRIYEYPDLSSDFTTGQPLKSKSDLEYKDFFHLNKIGWVHKTEVSAQTGKPSVAYKLLNYLGLNGWYYNRLDRRRRKTSHDAAFMIVATRN